MDKKELLEIAKKIKDGTATKEETLNFYKELNAVVEKINARLDTINQTAEQN